MKVTCLGGGEGEPLNLLIIKIPELKPNFKA